MPRKYPDRIKQEAIGILQIHDDISLTHYATGVHRRTLRRWRDDLKNTQNGYMSEKVFASDIKRTQNQHQPPDALSADQSESCGASDYEDFAFIRQQLMKHARKLALDLRPSEADGNRRTLALARIIDRINSLDRILPEQAKKLEDPPWQEAREDWLSLDAAPWMLAKVEQAADEVDDNLKERVYKYYAEEHRAKQKRALW